MHEHEPPGWRVVTGAFEQCHSTRCQLAEPCRANRYSWFTSLFLAWPQLGRGCCVNVHVISPPTISRVCPDTSKVLHMADTRGPRNLKVSSHTHTIWRLTATRGCTNVDNSHTHTTCASCGVHSNCCHLQVLSCGARYAGFFAHRGSGNDIKPCLLRDLLQVSAWATHTHTQHWQTVDACAG